MTRDQLSRAIREFLRTERFGQKVVSAQFRRHNAIACPQPGTRNQYHRYVQTSAYVLEHLEAVQYWQVGVQDDEIRLERNKPRKSTDSVLHYLCPGLGQRVKNQLPRPLVIGDNHDVAVAGLLTSLFTSVYPPVL